MASAVDEISSLLGIPVEGSVAEDELKSPEQHQASMFAARQQLQAKAAERQGSPGAAVKKVAAIKPQFKSSTLSKKPSSFQAPFKKNDYDDDEDIKKPHNVVSPKQRSPHNLPKKSSPSSGLKKSKTSPVKISPTKSHKHKQDQVIECSRNIPDPSPPQSKSFVEKRDLIHKTVERLKHTQEMKSPTRSPTCERQLPTVSSRYHSPSLKRQRGRQVEESAPSPVSSDEEEPIKKSATKSPVITKPSPTIKSPVPKSPVIAQKSPPTKCLRTPPPRSASPLSPSHPVQDHTSFSQLQSPPPVDRISPKLTSPHKITYEKTRSDDETGTPEIVTSHFLPKDHFKTLVADEIIESAEQKKDEMEKEVIFIAGKKELIDSTIDIQPSSLSKPFNNPLLMNKQAAFSNGLCLKSEGYDKTEDTPMEKMKQESAEITETVSHKTTEEEEEVEMSQEITTQESMTDKGDGYKINKQVAKLNNISQEITEEDLDQKIKEQEAKVSEVTQEIAEQEARVSKDCLDVGENNLNKVIREEAKLSEVNQEIAEQEARVSKDCLEIAENNLHEVIREEEAKVSQVSQEIAEQETRVSKDCLEIAETNIKNVIKEETKLNKVSHELTEGDQEIKEQEARAIESKNSVEEMEKQFSQIQELTKSCIDEVEGKKEKIKKRNRKKDKVIKEEDESHEIISQSQLYEVQQTEDEIGRQKLEDFFTRKRKEFGINFNQPPTPKGADRPKPLFKFSRKEGSDSERKSQEEKSPSHCSRKSPGKFKSTFKALGGGSEEAKEGKQTVKQKGTKEKVKTTGQQQNAKPATKRKINRPPQQTAKSTPVKKVVKRKVETTSCSSSEESEQDTSKPKKNDDKVTRERKRRRVYSSSSSSSSTDNEDQFSFNAQNESNEGLWVQCEIKKCGKWRLLRGVSDPNSINSTWTCSDSTDLKRNKCSAAEENWNELETGYEYVYSAYSMGSLVWCKMQGFPWWPGMVDMDPDSKTFYYTSSNSELPDKYHVTFFGKQPTRAWIGNKSMKVYNPDHKEEKYDQSKSSKGMREAVAMANQAFYLELHDRRKIYGYKEQMGGKDDLPTKIKVKSTLRSKVKPYDVTAPSVSSSTLHHSKLEPSGQGISNVIHKASHKKKKKKKKNHLSKDKPTLKSSAIDGISNVIHKASHKKKKKSHLSKDKFTLKSLIKSSATDGQGISYVIHKALHKKKKRKHLSKDKSTLKSSTKSSDTDEPSTSKGRGRPRKDSAQANKTKAKKQSLVEKASMRSASTSQGNDSQALLTMMEQNIEGGEESYIPAPRDVRLKNQLNVIENIENEINQVLRECSPSPTEF